MFNFTPEREDKKVEEVPYFEDATAVNGWAGQTTSRSIETLKSMIMQSITKLGGMVTGFEKGNWGKRAGYRVHYVIETPDGHHVKGYIDAAALPIKPVRYYSGRRTPELVKVERALQMALYNIALCLDSLWKLQRLSPGFAPLMPFMIINKDGQNLTQAWSQTYSLKALMPPKGSDFKTDDDHDDAVDGEVREVKE